MNEIMPEKKELIRKEAKKIVDNFTRALEKVNLKEKKNKKIVGGFREEKNGINSDKDFRKIMFENAPNKNENNILAEKKSW